MLMDEINTVKQDSDAQATLTSSISVKRSRTNENQNNTSIGDYSPTTAVTYRRLIDTIIKEIDTLDRLQKTLYPTKTALFTSSKFANTPEESIRRALS